MSFENGLNHVVHLAKQVHKKNWLMIQILQSVHLLFVKILHFMRCYYLIIVKVYHFEPVAHAAHSRLVLFAEHEPHEVFVIHFIFCLAFELAGHLVEDAVNGFAR